MARKKTESELASLEYVSKILQEKYPIVRVDIPELEYDNWDIYYTATTSGKVYTNNSIEVKRCKGDFTSDRYLFTSAITATTAFEINPFPPYTYKLTQKMIEKNITNNVPEALQGKHIYMLNAAAYTKNGDNLISPYTNYKWNDIVQSKQNVCVVYLYKNALLFFNHNDIKNAFQGYYWYNTSYVNQKNAIHFKDGIGWQRKAMIDMDKATVIYNNMTPEEYNAIIKPLYENRNKQ